MDITFYGKKVMTNNSTIINNTLH